MGKVCGGSGPEDAPILIIAQSPGRSELIEGRPLVGASGRILRAAFSAFGHSLDACRLLNTINCYPEDGEKISNRQKEACAERLSGDLSRCTPSVVLLLGADALEAVTGLSGPKNGISAWQGYILRPETLPKQILPSSVRAVVPAYHPAFIMCSGMRSYLWLKSAVGKAVRISRGQFREEEIPLENGVLPEEFDLLSFDIETDRGTGGMTDIGLAWKQNGTEGALSENWCMKSFEKTKRALETPSTKLVFNANFDIPRLKKEGIKVNGPVKDLLFAAQILDPDAPGHSLNEVSAYYLDIGRWKHLKDKDMGRYNRADAFVLLPLWARMKHDLEKTGQMPVFDGLMECLPVLLEMHERGLRIDPVERERHRGRYQKRAEWAGKRWAEVKAENSCSCNEGKTKTGKAHKKCAGTGQLPLLPRSPKVTDLLYRQWGLPPQFIFENGKLTDRWCADAEAIETLLELEQAKPHRKYLQALLRCRHYPKFITTYIDITDRIHPSYSPTTKDDASGKKFTVSAATGRLVAKGERPEKGKPGTPPIQQMPKPMRTMVIADPGFTFVAADYDSQELRLIAYVSGDENLLKDIENGIDIHGENARLLDCDRTRAKNAFYGWAYGARARALVAAFKQAGFDLNLEQAAAMLARLSNKYPGVPGWHKRAVFKARSDHYIANGWGRRRYFFDPDGSFNEVVNYEIQSSGAEMGRTSVVPIHTLAKRLGGWLAILVHDEFVAHIPKDRVKEFIPEFRKILEREFKEVRDGFFCPVTIKVGDSWGRMVKYEV